MSRIQNILDKADRDGMGRRVHGLSRLESTVRAGELARAESLPFTNLDVGAAAATAVPAPITIRIVTGARLDRRFAVVSSNETTGEQYRALRTRILRRDSGLAVNVLLVTSPGRGEGKTLTAGNLGLTMAQEYQRRVCLAEVNLRHPRFQRLFGLPDGPGLADVLAGKATLDDALLTIQEHNITVLPAGELPARPAELLGTTTMRRVIETLRARFDCVIVDAPAAGPLADVGIITPLVDSVLLVVRSAVTSKPSIHDAVATFDRHKLLGLILNDADAA
jgi:capsular exopolysaccharide synthesis family protein